MADRGELHVLSGPEAVAAATADLFVDSALTALADRGTFSVSLAGGNTPRAAYALLAQEPRRSRLSWSDVHIYFGDERCVPPDDEQSNYRMAQKTFLDAVGIPATNVHRIRGEADPQEAAAEYARELTENLGGPVPRFDLMLLGMGDDGHTASLFPGSSPEAENDALVRAVYAPSQAMWRVTLTPLVINNARTIAFGIEGHGKAESFHAVFQGTIDPVTYPSQIVRPADGRLIWYVDNDAAGMLEARK
jgi:6-phosphogluconolactonase